MKVQIIILFIFFAFFESSTRAKRRFETRWAFASLTRFYLRRIFFEVMLGSGSVQWKQLLPARISIIPSKLQVSFYISHGAKKRLISLNGRMAYQWDITDNLSIEQGYLLGYGGAWSSSFRTTQVTYNYSRGTPSKIHPNSSRKFGQMWIFGRNFCRCGVLYF